MSKTARNDVTGDKLISKTLSKEGEANWDRIFGKKDKTQDPITKPFPHNILRQSRIDTIGQNGNEGIHYDSDDNVDRWSAVLRDEYDTKYWKDQ